MIRLEDESSHHYNEVEQSEAVYATPSASFAPAIGDAGSVCEEFSLKGSEISRKRKRSPAHEAMLSEKMTLRKRAKKSYTDMIRPASKSILGRAPDQTAEFAFDAQTGQVGGASYVRYEVIEKKGEKVLVPVRYSIRNCNLDTTFHTKEALQALKNASYQPSEMESLFSMDETAQQTAMLLRSHLAPQLVPEDFETVLKVHENFTVVGLNEVGSAKFQGARQVAVPNRSIASMSQTKQADLVKHLLHSLKKEAKRKGEPQSLLMFTECSLGARNAIKKLAQNM